MGCLYFKGSLVNYFNYKIKNLINTNYNAIQSYWNISHNATYINHL